MIPFLINACVRSLRMLSHAIARSSYPNKVAWAGEITAMVHKLEVLKKDVEINKRSQN